MSTVYDLYQSYLNQLQNPVTQSPVTNYNPLLYLQQQQMNGGDSGGINNIVQGDGFGKPPSALSSFLVGLAAPPVGAAMGLRNLASRGQLPFGLNEVFGNEYTGSGINKQAFQRGIQSAMDDTDPADIGMSSFDAAVSAGIQAAEDDI